ncbi:hypothetical protein CLV98_11242 [Dyadobacter jejuensis]|uniref:Choice-of-anchor I domain-containing protein n=1 Tax=Dyadobacter jejuensis TaxID=1082580 RepID=A0A316AFA8_9BACT|nr:choice-of-anchor I family protein [Dyadobacter jejuensis]PWJ55948.1 hypothetical protein CLV98_11242 [Dyadobacter jejuensis]
MKLLNSIALLGTVALFFNSCTDHQIGNPVQEDPSKFTEIASIDLGGEAASEITAYDPTHMRLFTVNNENQALVEVMDLSAFPAITKKSPIDVSALGGVANSVAVSGQYLAIAVEATNKQANGHIVVIDLATLQVLKSIEVGALPDMVTFSPDGKYIVSANEGEPNDAYTVDPLGTISIIDIPNGFSVKTLDFSHLEGAKATLMQDGFRIFGPGASFAQDIEPEYVAISDDSKMAYVTLQENNGVAEVDLINGAILRIHALGTKDYNLAMNAIDASDKDGKIALSTWPVKSFLMPDAIAYFNVGGNGYFITANEGDAREYTGFVEEERVKNLTLDPTTFPTASTLQKDAQLGRLKITTTAGDTDGDKDFDVLYGFGGRGFSIFNANSGTMIYESGKELEEKVIAAGWYDDDRSDDKGVEPEGVTIGWINHKPVAFVAMERVNAVAIYDLTDPSAPKFLQLIKTGSAPEGIIYVPAEKSPNKMGLLITSNEGDGTVKFFQMI